MTGLSGVGIVTVSCGDTHTLALSSSGRVYSFGRNQNGQLGTGTDEDSLEPTLVSRLADVSAPCQAPQIDELQQIYAIPWVVVGDYIY